MSDQRQKIQLVLAFADESRSEAPRVSAEGTESLAAKCRTESSALGEPMMEEVCEQGNCKRALKRVKANKGSPGVDGRTVQELPGFLQRHWPAIREQMLSGTYQPQAVRRKEIDKTEVPGIQFHPRPKTETADCAESGATVSGTSPRTDEPDARD